MRRGERLRRLPRPAAARHEVDQLEAGRYDGAGYEPGDVSAAGVATEDHVRAVALGVAGNRPDVLAFCAAVWRPVSSARVDASANGAMTRPTWSATGLGSSPLAYSAAVMRVSEIAAVNASKSR